MWPLNKRRCGLEGPEVVQRLGGCSVGDVCPQMNTADAVTGQEESEREVRSKRNGRGALVSALRNECAHRGKSFFQSFVKGMKIRDPTTFSSDSNGLCLRR
ncbi:hypothetical protein E1B28_003404 [Marasmius oreades]|uniref:Uncharacterized protein n=1 Tax=Marasmius oreades TaxID=181124 RepID=A0A9P7RLF1_9AGAR|nr:uncharacterized protein E1B28_003404 [Marasmius oreades]KAG7085871.1 hypothetical protein E1B28_003404 [Marasmius oreades]